jgi:hypothetical protein
MFKILGAALVAAVTFGAAASAATLSGTFSVTAVNVTNVNSLQSAATTANFDAALAGTFGAFATDTFTYVGEIDFGTFDHTDATTISDWLDTGTPGGVSGLDAAFGDLQLSKDNIFASPATASTTFFLFTLQKIMSSAANFTVTHDDGVAFFDDGVGIGGFSAPTVVKETKISGFDGGKLSFLYVATNGDPSVLKVDATVIPVPAALPLLLAGLGGLALLKRRKAA